MAITSIKPDRDLATLPPILPSEITFQHYQTLFEGRPFYRYIINSTIVAAATTVVCLLIGSLAGYAFGRLKFPGRLPLLLAVLVVSMFPQIAIVAPIYVRFQQLGLLNTYQALIIPYNTFALPLAIWVLTSFFRSIPGELEDASRVDGSTRLGALFRVILPLSAPGLFTTAILVFIAAWNEFLLALTLTSSIDHQTIPVGHRPAAGHVPRAVGQHRRRLDHRHPAAGHPGPHLPALDRARYRRRRAEGVGNEHEQSEGGNSTLRGNG